MDIADLEAKLAEARARRDQSDMQSLSDATLERMRASRQDCLAAERALSLAKGEETALQIDWEVPWDVGAPLPHVLAYTNKVFLIYLSADEAPLFKTNPVNPEDEQPALVQFKGCHAFKFGDPNDEVLHGHPLYGRGLELYSAHIVANSSWLAELQRINSVHEYYDASIWHDLKHYLLTFHDDTFECIARGYSIEVLQRNLRQAVEEAVERLFRI